MSYTFNLYSFRIQRLVAAITSIPLWFKVLDWLRLFDSTAFYVKLIITTVYGIRYFIIIMFLWYMLFGTAFYLLNLDRDEETSVMPARTGFWVTDAL